MRPVLKAATVLATSTVVVLGGVQVVSATTTPSTFSACVKTNGSLYGLVADRAPLCDNDDRTITWNQQGVPGAAGAQGAQGPQGPQGPKGDPGAASLPDVQRFVPALPTTLAATNQAKVATITAAPGSYLFDAALTARSSNVDVTCFSLIDPVGDGSLATGPQAVVQGGLGSVQTLAAVVHGVVRVTTPSTVELWCRNDSGTASTQLLTGWEATLVPLGTVTTTTR